MAVTKVLGKAAEGKKDACLWSEGTVLRGGEGVEAGDCCHIAS